MEYYTYVLIDSRNNKIFYVGKGQKLRMYAHVKDVQRDRIPNGSNVYLGRKIKKILSSENKVKYKKVFITEIGQQAFDKEKELIAEIGLENLCNVAPGGIGSNGNKGRTFTAEHRKRISDSVKKSMSLLPEEIKKRIYENRKLPWPKASEETKRKISKTNKGRICSEETKRKISSANKGKTGGPHNLGRIFTTDHKQNLSNSLKRYWKNKSRRAD